MFFFFLELFYLFLYFSLQQKTPVFKHFFKSIEVLDKEASQKAPENSSLPDEEKSTT